MKTKRTLLIIILWALFLVPVLCQAGELDHSCFCFPESPCDHEVSCFADPCNQLIAPALDSHQVEVIPPAPVAVLFNWEPGTQITEPPAGYSSRFNHPLTTLPNVPLVADLPLIC